MLKEAPKHKTRRKSATESPAERSPVVTRVGRSGAVANRIRVRRRHLNLTLDDLSRKAALDKGYLSRIERGQKVPSIDTLLRIATALEIQMAQLFGEVTAPDAVTVFRRDRKGGRPAKARAETTFDAILPPHDHRRLSAYLISPDREIAPEAAEHPGDELIYVLSGSLAVIFADRTVELDAGDCVHFDGHLEHRMRRTSRAAVQAMVIIATDLKHRGAPGG
jgi:transcriptional regulator with XRE-family HTH domain